tara:strand:- start:49 stop:537 length:489 start_codon:yes stop_codon:yes gene_type:complete
MDNQTYYQEKFIENVEEFDFNFISHLLDDVFLKSSTSHTFHPDYILDATYKIKGVHKHEKFKNIHIYLDNMFNKHGGVSNSDLFVNFTTGGNSTVHKDSETVRLIGLYGKTFYRFGDQECIVEPGDLLSIGSGVYHKAVGLSPRICMSYGTWEKGSLIHGDI